MILFLSGGGNSKDSKELDKRFLDLLPNKKFLYIPVALEGEQNYSYRKCYEWIKDVFSILTSNSPNITMLTDLASANMDFLKSFDAIYIGGGNTYKLIGRMAESKFNKLLLAFVKNGKPVYGGSAGAIIFGKSIATVEEENVNNSSSDQGLNLLKGFSVKCHYRNTKSEVDLINNFIKQRNGGVFALPEQTGLIITNTSIEVVGNKPAYVFSNKRRGSAKNIGKLIRTGSFVYL
ncbi:MAG: dipeptidase E [Microgenomates group bacterium Gr01-1014_5]|nr:MAG: dipeptidase E [Microgenomates group bacterium Gr01-1014_5]